jgi:hypothetical protein
MARRLTSLILPVIASAIVLCGCGGSSTTTASSPTAATASGSTGTTGSSGGGGALSASAYHLKVNAAIAPWDIAVHGLSSHVTPTALKAVASTATQGAQTLHSLKPPPAVAGLQNRLVDVLNANAEHARQWAQALQRNDKAAAGRYAAQFRQDGRDILRLDNEFKAKGVTL